MGLNIIWIHLSLCGAAFTEATWSEETLREWGECKQSFRVYESLSVCVLDCREISMCTWSNKDRLMKVTLMWKMRMVSDLMRLTSCLSIRCVHFSRVGVFAEDGISGVYAKGESVCRAWGDSTSESNAVCSPDRLWDGKEISASDRAFLSYVTWMWLHAHGQLNHQLNFSMYWLYS